GLVQQTKCVAVVAKVGFVQAEVIVRVAHASGICNFSFTFLWFGLLCDLREMLLDQVWLTGIVGSDAANVKHSCREYQVLGCKGLQVELVFIVLLSQISQTIRDFFEFMAPKRREPLCSELNSTMRCTSEPLKMRHDTTQLDSNII